MNDLPLPQIIIGALLVALFVFTRIRGQIKRKNLKAEIEAGAKVIDVRSPSEFSSGHYASAVNIPVDKLENKLKGLGPRETPIIVYCASGMRSASAQRILEAAGFSHVINAGKLSVMESI